MRLARIVFLLLSAGSLPVHAQLVQVDTTISLADALAHAASASPDVARGKANVWEARSQQGLAVGAFLPQIAYEANSSNADLAAPEPPLTSEATLVAAEQDAVTARYDYGIARAQLEALAGRSL